MPELPEVEIVKQSLKKTVKLKKIKKMQIQILVFTVKKIFQKNIIM